jgi:hypothetical protein
VYVALTNHCNRACPWCSTCSSPRGGTWLAPEAFLRGLPATGPFEVQLEGGEPTVHPRFWEFVAAARAHPRCRRVVLCTNGAALPREDTALESWVRRLGAPLTLKLSFNHHLLERDPRLPDLARRLRDLVRDGSGDCLFVLNVRLRPGGRRDEATVRAAVAAQGLERDANAVPLQSYGFAAGRAGWPAPRPVYDDFSFVNPDGAVLGPDLLARSEAMRRLP